MKIVFLFISEVCSLRVSKIQQANFFDVRAQSYSEFIEMARNKFGSFLVDAKFQNTLADMHLNNNESAGTSQKPTWVLINHKWGICYEADVNDQNGLRNIGWCVGSLSCLSTIAHKDQIEFYTNPPGVGCVGRGYTKISFPDTWYPPGIQAYFGWKIVAEAVQMFKNTPMEAELKGNLWVSPPPDAVLLRNLDYITKCQEVHFSDEYSYQHPECAPPGAPPTAALAAAAGRLPQVRWYNSPVGDNKELPPAPAPPGSSGQ